MIKKLLDSLSLSSTASEDRNAALYKNFLKHEARVGGSLFGPVPKNGRREFFCLDEHTWIWHEEWTDERGQRRIVATRYDIRPNEVLKSQNGGHYQKVGQAELRKLAQAARLYVNKIKEDVYHIA